MKERVSILVRHDYDIEYDDSPGTRERIIHRLLTECPIDVAGVHADYGGYKMERIDEKGIRVCDQHEIDHRMRIDQIRETMADIVARPAISPWLHTFNQSFQCRPIDMIGTPREQELLAAINAMEEGRPG